MAELEVELLKSFGAKDTGSESQMWDMEFHDLIYTAGWRFSLAQIVTVPWLFPFGIRNIDLIF